MKTSGEVKRAGDFVVKLLCPFFALILWIVYGLKFDMKTSKGIKRPCIILSNHQSVIDQFVVSLGFRFGINYVASDTIFRHGILSRLMVALVQPIPFSKGNSDMRAVRNMISVIKKGGCVAMFPSGNRSFFGDECRIVPGIGKLVKKLNATLVLMQIRGGFNTKARWMAKVSRGKMTGSVARVINPEELGAMENAEIDSAILKVLNFNEFDYNRNANIQYRGKRRAEYLESVLFYCPNCKSMIGLYSRGNEFLCRQCQMKVVLNNAGFFENTPTLPQTILEWSRLQLDHIKKFDFSPFLSESLFRDEGITFSRGEYAKKEYFAGKGSIELYSDRLCVCGLEFRFGEITTSLTGVRKLIIYRGSETYAALSPLRTNLAKYMICAYHLRNKEMNIEEGYYGY